jgi:hypothetical protein
MVLTPVMCDSQCMARLSFHLRLPPPEEGESGLSFPDGIVLDGEKVGILTSSIVIQKTFLCVLFFFRAPDKLLLVT